MAEVHLSVGGQQFSMRCSEGDKPVLERVGELLDRHWSPAHRAASTAGPFRVLLLAAMTMGADLMMALDADGTTPQDTPDLAALAERIEALADALERALPDA